MGLLHEWSASRSYGKIRRCTPEGGSLPPLFVHVGDMSVDGTPLPRHVELELEQQLSFEVRQDRLGRDYAASVTGAGGSPIAVQPGRPARPMGMQSHRTPPILPATPVAAALPAQERVIIPRPVLTYQRPAGVRKHRRQRKRDVLSLAPRQDTVMGLPRKELELQLLTSVLGELGLGPAPQPLPPRGPTPWHPSR